MKSCLSVAVLACIFSMSANATLLGRLSDGAGGYQAYYDDGSGITWLTNANLAESYDFGVGGVQLDGKMTWPIAKDWIAEMNAYESGNGWLGSSNWQLPEIGWMSGLFFNTLGNVITTDPDCRNFRALPDLCLKNTGPFLNLQRSGYWSNTEVPPDEAYQFEFGVGWSELDPKTGSTLFVFPVIVGDAFVPIPPTLWLFGSGLIGLIGVARKKKAA